MGPGARVTRALAAVAARSSGAPLPPGAVVTVHFHPDRLVGEVLLLRHLVSDGVYRSQFETGTSAGGLTAHPGGDRWHWEHRMFDGAYDDAPHRERPKYGALDVRGRRGGAAVRFGSSHLRVADHVLDRTTFCYPDSSEAPTTFGVRAAAGAVLDLARADHLRDPLDDHVEAHVHGPLVLDRDVAALVLDPSFRATDVAEAARDLPVPVEWHEGFRLHVDELAALAWYRGPEVVALGVAVADEGWLDARVVGDAARTGRHHPQRVKQLWHCVARFGHPAER